MYIGGGVSSVEYWLSWIAGRARTIVVTLDGLFRVRLKPAWLPTPFASFPFTSPPVRRRVPPDSVSTLQLFVYHLTTWYKSHEGKCLSRRKTQTLSLWSLSESSVFFWSRKALSPLTAAIASWFQHHNHKPCLISYYDVLKKGFITICIGKQFLPDFNVPLFLIAIQKPRHEFWTEATHLNFFKKIYGTILCWFSHRQQFLGELKNNFNESQQGISRLGHRLFMWNVVQSWGLHRPKFCPP